MLRRASMTVGQRAVSARSESQPASPSLAVVSTKGLLNRRQAAPVQQCLTFLSRSRVTQTGIATVHSCMEHPRAATDVYSPRQRANRSGLSDLPFDFEYVRCSECLGLVQCVPDICRL